MALIVITSSEAPALTTICPKYPFKEFKLVFLTLEISQVSGVANFPAIRSSLLVPRTVLMAIISMGSPNGVPVAWQLM
eukprot:CAMPEP_0170554762 /NCGR_PEP_ID=MMETSP0211-20121228/12641_1 /TAXON_ID=311385 /ORGANISM="Pseudokeronopsis sp., Strain OXSARD2" /LENGTH=77 /DNA_ID=CAMNT_0010864093 /DNA_START=107 /DNA_END=340 /DNA_ORIENTATION=+